MAHMIIETDTMHLLRLLAVYSYGAGSLPVEHQHCIDNGIAYPMLKSLADRYADLDYDERFVLSELTKQFLSRVQTGP